MECGPNYPREPPKINFITMINLPGVNERNGELDMSKIEFFREWENTWLRYSKSPKPDDDPLSLESSLNEIRKFVSSAPFSLSAVLANL